MTRSTTRLQRDRVVLCHDAALGEAVIEGGETDLIAPGVPFLANRDLPERFHRGAALDDPDEASFHQPGADDAVGYTDHPALTPQVA